MFRERNLLIVSLQDRKSVEKALEYNAKNDYKYLITCDNKLVNYDIIAYMIRVGYKLQPYADEPTLAYKTYDFSREIKEESDINEK